MDTDKLNETLSTLETNLRNLNSAREQVEKVTESSDALTKSTESLLNIIEKLSTRFDKDSKSGLMQLSNILEDFKEKHESFIAEREKSILKNITDFKKTSVDLSTSLKTNFVEVNNANDKQLENYKKKLDALIEENSNSINNNIGEFDTSTSKVTVSIKETLSDLQEKNSQQVADFENKLDVLITESKNNINNSNEEFKTATLKLKSVTESEIKQFKDLSVSTIKKQAEEISESLQEFKDLSAKQTNSLEIFQKSINEKNMALSKKQTIFSIITWVIIVSGFFYIAFNK